MDANTYYLNQHQAKVDEDSSRELWLEGRVKELLSDSHSPAVFENFCESMGNIVDTGSICEIDKALEDKDYEALGKIVFKFNEDYWKFWARHKAQEELDGPRDYDYF